MIFAFWVRFSSVVLQVLECLWRQRWSRTVDGLGALIISPTRELAFQTFQVLNKIGAHHQFSVAVLIGGMFCAINYNICLPSFFASKTTANIRHVARRLPLPELYFRY